MLEQLLDTGVFETTLYKVELVNGRTYKVYNRTGDTVFERNACFIAYWELEQFLKEK